MEIILEAVVLATIEFFVGRSATSKEYQCHDCIRTFLWTYFTNVTYQIIFVLWTNFTFLCKPDGVKLDIGFLTVPVLGPVEHNSSVHVALSISNLSCCQSSCRRNLQVLSIHAVQTKLDQCFDYRLKIKHG